MSAVLRGNLRMALSGVRSSKWRSMLTVLGIIVGIVAVVLVVGIGEGVKRQIAGTLDHFGKNLVIVRPLQAGGASPVSIGRSDILFGASTTISMSPADAEVVHRASGVGSSTPLGVVPGAVMVNDRPVGGTKVLGVGADTPELLNQKVEYGDFWSGQDEDAHFAVLGRNMADALFNEPVPLGKTLTFRGQAFQVRGVFERFDKAPFSPTAGFDDVIFIPYKAAARLTNSAAGPYAILAKPDQNSKVGDVIASIQNDLSNARGGERDFSVLESHQSLEAGNGVVELLQMWILAVATISLLMGGVGIMNIMLLVVAERMHEIGVRKAVGATSRQILGQFVLEATVISCVGGIIGIVASTAAIGLLHVYTDLKPVISWPAVAIAAVVSIAIGIIFGTIPAIKAARKDPIEALRHE